MYDGAGYTIIMMVPTEIEAIDVMAKVTNVIIAIETGLETEFPKRCITGLFRCFRLTAVVPPYQARCQQLGHRMGLDQKQCKVLIASPVRQSVGFGSAGGTAAQVSGQRCLVHCSASGADGGAEGSVVDR